jgi:CheY-like chemotaxis protein
MSTSANELSEELAHQVRNALAHLYDYAYLQNHPLAKLVDNSANLDEVTRAQRLRRMLLDCIEALCPQTQEAMRSDAARAHALLTYRYVDGIGLGEIASRRGLSERQAYRELDKGVEAVASLLRERMAARPDEAEPLAATPTSPDDPLQAARTEAVRLKTGPGGEIVDLSDLIAGVLKLLTPLGERTGLRITLATPLPWPQVSADRVMLRQAFLNLLTYALNGIAQGDLSIAVATAAERITIEIGQTVCPTRLRPLPSPATPQDQVGPVVARALIEAQGGQLEICQDAGLWSARVTLSAAGEATILVIDDNQDLVDLLQRYLAGHHIKVVAATEGEQALRLATTLQPKLITLDVMLPSMDGWEILQRLRAAPESVHTPVVICSVLHEQELAQSLGASDYIVKPVRQADLIDVLQRWLGPPHPAQ